MAEGWSVQIKCKDGSTFLASSGMGILPLVWTLSHRKYAVKLKRELVAHGFKVEVVRVRFEPPEPVQGKESANG